MKIADFVIIKGQQGFEDGKEINPNIFEMYKRNRVKFKLKGILFASSIKSNNEKIFLQTVGISDAKYALINEKYKQTIGVINLDEIKNWTEIKKNI